MVAKFGPALALFCLVLNPAQAQLDEYERTKVVGHKEDARHVSYEAVSTKKAPLIGFEFGIGNKPPFVQVAAVRPIFKGETTDRTAVGRFEDGTAKGKNVKSPVHTTEKVVAKDGYAVSKVVVQYGLWIDSIQVHFAKIRGDGFDLTDVYHTNYYGSTEAKGAYTTLDGEGRQVVGVTATMDDVKATGFGLIYSGKLAPKPARPTTPQPVTVARPAPEPSGGLDAKSTPNGGSTIQLPGFDGPSKPAPNKAVPGPPTPGGPIPGIVPSIKPDLPALDAETKARIDKQNAEAREQFEQFSAGAKKQQGDLNKALAAMPKWDATPHDQEAAKEFWRKAIEAAEADPNLPDEKRAELAQIRKALGLEPRTNWLAIGIGLGVFGLIGTGAYFYLNRKPAPLPTARRVADDVDAEPLELEDVRLASPRESRRSSHF